MSRFQEVDFKKQFRVVLTDAEKDEARERMTNVMDELDEMRIRHKQVVDQASKDIKHKEGQVNALRMDIKVGALQDVDCTRKFDWHRGEVTEIRKDTGEILATRPVTDKERQLYLPGDDLKG